MPKSKSGFYAIKKGRETGIFTDWSEVERLVSGYPGARHKKFTTIMEAKEWLGMGMDVNVIAPSPVSTSSATPLPLASTSAGMSDTNTASPTRSTARITPYPVSGDSKSPKAGRGDKGRIVKEDDVLDESGWDVVYTDGSCVGNGGKVAVAGVGVWWGEGDPRNISERCPGEQTNNRAELIAIVRALETAPITGRPLLIKTDSSYSISCLMSWLPRWRTNNFRTSSGQPVKNVQLILFLSHLLSRRAKPLRLGGGGGVKLQHVKGHVGVEGNEGADRLAVRGTWGEAVSERDWEEQLEQLKKEEETDLGAKDGSIPQSDPTADKVARPEADTAGHSPNVPAARVMATRLSQPLQTPTIHSKYSAPSVPELTPEELEEYANCLPSAEELANEQF